MTAEPLDLEAAERRIYGPPGAVVGVPYTHIVLREVPLLLAEIRRLRALVGKSTGREPCPECGATASLHRCGVSS